MCIGTSKNEFKPCIINLQRRGTSDCWNLYANFVLKNLRNVYSEAFFEIYFWSFEHLINRTFNRSSIWSFECLIIGCLIFDYSGIAVVFVYLSDYVQYKNLCSFVSQLISFRLSVVTKTFQLWSIVSNHLLWMENFNSWILRIFYYKHTLIRKKINEIYTNIRTSMLIDKVNVKGLSILAVIHKEHYKKGAHLI